MEKKRKIIIVSAIIIVTVIAAIGYYVDVTTRWKTTTVNNIPEIELISPDDEAIIYANTTFFNWTSFDADADPLTHLHYLDLLPTMNSPHRQVTYTASVTNYTPTFVMDGVWYWRVEVSDSIDVNTSETRKVTFSNYPLNNIPEIINATISQNLGNTYTLFRYSMIYKDLDNDTPTIVRVYINNTPYNLLPVNISNTNYSTGVSYYYETTLPLGTHNYSFFVSDGMAVNTTEVFIGPLVTDDYNNPPIITLIAPDDGAIFETIGITFKWNVTDPDDNLLFSNLWVWKIGEDKVVYNVTSNTTLELETGIFQWRVYAVDEVTYTLSEIRTFAIIATGKQCKVTLQPEQTKQFTGSYFTGSLSITNEGELESYEVFWYVELWNAKRSKRYTSDVGSLAVATTVVVSYKVSVDEDMDAGYYYLRAFAYNTSIENNPELLGLDEVRVSVYIKVIDTQKLSIAWYSLVYDTPRYYLSLGEYPQATQFIIPLNYYYSFLFWEGYRTLKSVKTFIFAENTFMEIPVVQLSLGLYEFGEVTHKEAVIVIVPNPSITDVTWVYNWLHTKDIPV